MENSKMTLDIELWQEKIQRRGRYVILGLPSALLSFAQSLTGMILVDLIVYRTCLVSTNTNQTDCSILHTNSGSPEARNLEVEIEPHASVILMSKTLIESVFPAIISLFIGPWSDQAGRKPLLLAGITGFLVTFATLTTICNWDISPWYLLIPSIPAYLTGGSCTVALASNCYISDTTEEKDRTVFLALLQTLTFTGVLLGILTGPMIYRNYGYSTVFGVAMICCMYALLHVHFFVHESVKNVSKEPLHKLFKISFIKDIVNTSLVKRDGFHRPIVWLAMFVFTVHTMILLGDTTTGFLFSRARLGWDVQHYSYVSGTGIVLSITALCGISLLSPVLGISDTLLASVGLISALGAAATKSLAWQDWHMYLAVAIGMFSAGVGPVTRSIISKFVPAQDIGKVFALMALLRTLSLLGGSPILTVIYSRYLPPIYPSPVYLLESGVCILLIFCVLCLEILNRRSRNLTYSPTAREDIVIAENKILP